MISAVIIGTSAYSRLLKKLVETIYDPYAASIGEEGLYVTAYLDPLLEEPAEQELDGALVLCADEAAAAVREGLIGAILFPQQPRLDAQKLLFHLRLRGIPFEMIYFTPRTVLERSETVSAEELFVPYLDAGYLPYLEFHIEDACNMNCKACEHYSPLVRESKPMDYSVFEKDLHRLKELIPDIGTIRVLGGEPLMNGQLPQYIRLTRRLYPQADIFIVTNGLLLKRLSEETYAAMRETKAAFMVSLYRPMEHTIGDAAAYVRKKDIDVFCSPLIEEFSIKQNLTGTSDRERQFAECFQAGCNNLYQGHIAACFLPFTTHYFNEAFDANLPADGAISLHDPALTTRGLKERLLQPFERCRYCSPPVNIPWTQAQKSPTLSDWVLSE